MSIDIAEMWKRVAQGASGADLAHWVEEQISPSIAHRREQWREATERYRGRSALRQHDSHVDVSMTKKASKNNTRVSMTSALQAPLPTNSLPSTEEPNGSSVSGRNKRARNHRLPTDFKLTQGDIEFAQSKGFSPAETQEQFELFCDHWQGNGELKSDWHATWRNWVRRALKFNRNGGHSNGRRHVETVEERGERLKASIRDHAHEFGGSLFGAPLTRRSG